MLASNTQITKKWPGHDAHVAAAPVVSVEQGTRESLRYLEKEAQTDVAGQLATSRGSAGDGQQIAHPTCPVECVIDDSQRAIATVTQNTHSTSK